MWLHSYTLVILQTTSAFFSQALKTMMQRLCVPNKLTSEHENPNGGPTAQRVIQLHEVLLHTHTKLQTQAYYISQILIF